MAFSQQNSRELQNRKILEELQLKKQLLLKQGVAQTLSPQISTATTITSTALPQLLVSNDGATINSLQRAALLNAHSASAGYFVTQDSSFGNLILPVLPRFEIKLEEKLYPLSTFEKPNLLLEQYSTSSHIASRMLYVAQTQFEDIKNCTVADLGAGCGILSIGACMLGASQVTGFDIDISALKKFNENCQKMKISIEKICCDINYLPGKFEKFYETVIMNPPFGTKCNAGIDIKFLEIASKIAKKTIYSLHKSTTRTYVLKKGYQFGFHSQVLAELKYDLPKTYKFHKKTSLDIKVDFIRFSAIY